MHHVAKSPENATISRLPERADEGEKKGKQNTYVMRLEDHLSIHRIDLAALAGVTQVRVAD